MANHHAQSVGKHPARITSYEDPGDNFLEYLLLSGKYSDLVLVCDGAQLNLHKSVLCTQSPVIAAAIDFQFMESTTGRISVEGHSIETMTRFAQFLYVKDYSTSPGESQTWPSSGTLKGRDEKDNFDTTSPDPDYPNQAPYDLVAEIDLNIAADYYNVPALSAKTRHRVMRILEDSWDASIFPAILEKVESEAGDMELQNILITAAKRHLSDLVTLPAFRDPEQISTLALQILTEYVKSASEKAARPNRQGAQRKKGYRPRRAHPGNHIYPPIWPGHIPNLYPPENNHVLDDLNFHYYPLAPRPPSPSNLFFLDHY